MKKQIGLAFLFLACLGCDAEVYHDLHENEANQMVMVLQASGIESHKKRDGQQGRWLVSVSDVVKVDALRALAHAGLPKPRPSGVEEFYPSRGLIPTADEEHVLAQFAHAQEIRKSFLTIDGVTDAQVNLVLPRRSKLRLKASPDPARGSVVIKYNREAPPLSESEVRSIVAGGVGSMRPEDVVVVFSRSEWGTEAPELSISSVGPIAVTSGSKSMAQFVFGSLFTIIVLLSGAIVAILMRRRTDVV